MPEEDVRGGAPLCEVPQREYVPSPNPMNNAEIEEMKRKNLEQMERIKKDREKMKRLKANGYGRLS
jgi:hypothetical protein